MHASEILFYEWWCDHKIFQRTIIIYIIPVFIMFASTFKVLTGLSLAIVLARFPAQRGALRRQPRNLSNGDSSLVKIGVNLVSYSCWEMESHRHRWSTNRFRHQPLEITCCTHRPEWSCTTHFVFRLKFLYQVVSHQLTVILGLVSTRAIFWKTNIPKNRSWQTWYQSQADHWLILS